MDRIRFGASRTRGSGDNVTAEPLTENKMLDPRNHTKQPPVRERVFDGSAGRRKFRRKKIEEIKHNAGLEK